MLCASAEAMTNKASPWSRVCWPKDVCVSSSARVTPVTALAVLVSVNASLSAAASLTPTSAFSIWSLSERVSILWATLTTEVYIVKMKIVIYSPSFTSLYDWLPFPEHNRRYLVKWWLPNSFNPIDTCKVKKYNGSRWDPKLGWVMAGLSF